MKKLGRLSKAPVQPLAVALFVLGLCVLASRNIGSLQAALWHSQQLLNISSVKMKGVDHGSRCALRNYSYLYEPPETRYQNRVVVFVFAGRQSRLEVQLPYLEQLVVDGEIDYVHYSVCRPDAKDYTWLQYLAKVMPLWFELKEYNITDARKADAFFIATYNEYRAAKYRNTMLVKIDDDIVFLPLGGAITHAVEYARANPNAAWVSGLVVNHPIYDNWLQEEGIIPYRAQMDFTRIHNEDGILGNQNNTIYAEQRLSWRSLHSFFLENSSIFKNLQGTRIVPAGSRVSLNFMIFSPEHVWDWNLRGEIFDEWRIMKWTLETNRTVHLFKGATAVHFDYGRQRRIKGMVDEDYLLRYMAFACSQILSHQEENGCANTFYLYKKQCSSNVANN